MLATHEPEARRETPSVVGESFRAVGTIQPLPYFTNIGDGPQSLSTRPSAVYPRFVVCAAPFASSPISFIVAASTLRECMVIVEAEAAKGRFFTIPRHAVAYRAIPRVSGGRGIALETAQGQAIPR